MKQYDIGEEIANAITHGIGIIFSIVALVLMVVFAACYGNAWQVVSVSIYGATSLAVEIKPTGPISFAFCIMAAITLR